MGHPAESRIWDPAETLAPGRLRELQSQRLREVFGRASRVAFYAGRLAESGLTVEPSARPELS